jgi:hypothetical protein
MGLYGGHVREATAFLTIHPAFFPPPQIHSDSDEGDGTIKYTISGEGAGTIFLIDELTGDIHATERLDREQKTFYTLRAQARDRATNRLLEPESEFIIKVQDINDSEPRFLHGPYIGSVAELSPTGGPGVGMGEAWGQDAPREAGMCWFRPDGKGRKDRVATPGCRGQPGAGHIPSYIAGQSLHMTSATSIYHEDVGMSVDSVTTEYSGIATHSSLAVQCKLT